MARLARARCEVASCELPSTTESIILNPSLHVLDVRWSLSDAFSKGSAEGPLRKEREWIAVWRNPQKDELRTEKAEDGDLLVVKLYAEGISAQEAAHEGRVPVGTVDRLVWRAIEKGLLLAPPPRLWRAADRNRADTPERFLRAENFTLQWHITNRCDLHCKHCYDRSQRSPLTLEQGLRVLDEMRSFCWDRYVRGHVCLTGGNPLLHPAFLDLYRAAADRGFNTSILGNPASEEDVERIVEVQRPRYYQVSLEGLAEHNDSIRGEGHFRRTLEFLDVLRAAGVRSAVMLTLTDANIDQVLPLAEELRGKTDSFTFNRLSPVGEGAHLLLPSPERYSAFMEDYLDAARENAMLTLKDNLLNPVRDARGEGIFGGCTGYGCGAAFNFLALLPDGEVHACRKFPSAIGNVGQNALAEIYDSEAADRYRRGTATCGNCALHAVCAGCMAVTSGLGLDPFTECDPFCPIASS